ncbi:ABC transporter substrate-binding protein [Bradyrhizobium sp. OAE829]|uniref:ABC transporter substrate-binding protein n=1 Tax=Bradyrhizobium sp. OAE829 TaxID=2663807 RepID=UPI00178B7F81
MRRRKFIALLGGAVASSLSANAQQSVTPLIGFLSSRSARDSVKVVAAFAKGLGEVGFTEGKNLSIEYRFADGALDRLPEMAAELVKRPIAALVAVGGSNSAMAAKRASSTIPIVFVIGGDPVRLGLAASLSRPAGNATGMTIISADLAPKRLGLLRELVPNAAALAALTNPNTPEGRGQSADMLTAALALGLKLRLLEASDERGIEAAFAALTQDKPDALLVGSDPIFDVHRDKLVALVAAAAIPAIYQFRDFAAAGGLMSYDPDIVDAHRQIGIYVGKILKGALPADLPVQQPTKFQLILNLRTAKTLGLTVSPTLLARADEVIE